MSASLCKIPGCVCYASVGAYCTVHSEGYRQHDGGKEIRCWICHRVIKPGDWMRKTNDVDWRHVRTCKPSEWPPISQRGQKAGAR